MGGIIQLVAYGVQDIYLTGSPQITFFKAIYKRHTNFAMELVQLDVVGSSSGTPLSTRHHDCTISRNGDLVTSLSLLLTATVTDKKLLDRTAEHCINNIQLRLDDKLVDRHYSSYLRVLSELTMNSNEKRNYNAMTSCLQIGVAKQITLPLQFFFNKNPGLALPLIALQYGEVKLRFVFDNANGSITATDPSIWANYIYLDTSERQMFSQSKHEYLIEQVQQGPVTTLSSSTAGGNINYNIKLNFENPIKEIYWLAQHTNYPGYYGSSNQYPTFDRVSTTSNGVYQHYLNGDELIVSSNSSSFSEEDFNTFDTASLLLDGEVVLKSKNNLYFNQTQPYYCHTGAPQCGIYSYSFAIKPEEYQPSGTLNFSRLDHIYLNINSSNWAGTNNISGNWNIYGLSYNVLRVMSGKADIQFR